MKIIAASLAGGFVLGGIGFVGGFFGPMIFAPGANQGPLLGIFITGPLGFVLGCVGGGLAAFCPPAPAVQHAMARRS
jgi:hypothetical protein